MICCRRALLSLIFRSNHYGPISNLKNTIRTLKEEKHVNKAPQRLKQLLVNDEILKMYPTQSHRKTVINTKAAQILYLVNESTASKIAQYLTSLPDLTIPFVETNPGPGLLTDLLIQKGMTDLRLFERNNEFLQHLTDTYVNNYPDRVKSKQVDLIDLFYSWYTDNYYGGKRVDKIISGLPTTEWTNDINFRLFGATGSMAFFKYLISSIVFQDGLLSLGRCEMYMVIPSTTYIDLASSPKTGYSWYRSNSILFQIFFEYELLDKFPRNGFLPCISKTGKKHNAGKEMTKGKGFKITPIDSELMYFIKIVPRRNLYNFCSPNQIKELWHFIKTNCHSRSNRIYPSLEKLIPGCGVKLIFNLNKNRPVRSMPIQTANICEIPTTTNPSMTLSNKDYYESLNIYTQFGDLQPSQLLTLFHEFRKLQEYSSCNFLPSLDGLLLKMRVQTNK